MLIYVTAFLFFLAMYPLAAFATVTISPITELFFGTLETPTIASSDITLDRDTVSGTGSMIVIHPTYSRGEYLLTSTENSGTVTIDIQNINTGSSALVLSNFKGRYGGQAIDSFPASGLSAPNNGTTLYLGAKLTATPPIQESNPVMSFTIVVNFE